MIVPGVAMAPGVAGMAGSSRVAWQHGCNCNGGGGLFHVEHICGAAGRGPQHDDIDCAVRGGREGEAGGSCLV